MSEDKRAQQAAVADELAERIAAAAQVHGGTLPERSALAWRGYLAGLIEWDIISVAGHDRLVALLPAIDDTPVREILLGVDPS